MLTVTDRPTAGSVATPWDFPPRFWDFVAPTSDLGISPSDLEICFTWSWASKICMQFYSHKYRILSNQQWSFFSTDASTSSVFYIFSSDFLLPSCQLAFSLPNNSNLAFFKSVFNYLGFLVHYCKFSWGFWERRVATQRAGQDMNHVIIINN